MAVRGLRAALKVSGDLAIALEFVSSVCLRICGTVRLIPPTYTKVDSTY
jgi:hypothetical protein